MTTTNKRAHRDTLRAVIEALPELRLHGVERVRVGADGSVEVELDTRAGAGALTVNHGPINVQQVPQPQQRDGTAEEPDPPATQPASHQQAAGDDLDVAHLG